MNYIKDFRSVVELMSGVTRRYIVVSAFVSLTYDSRSYNQILTGEMSAKHQGDVVAFFWPSVFEFISYFQGLKLVSLEYNNAWTGTPKLLDGYKQQFDWMRIPKKIRMVFNLGLEVIEPATDVTVVFEC